MATYEELFGLHNDSALKNRVTPACIIAAETIRAGDDTVDPPWDQTNNTNRLIWAAAVFDDPRREANRMFWALLAANKDLTVAQIQAATDAAIQSNVSTAVDLFATGV